MPLTDKIVKYSVYVAHWPQINGSHTTLYMFQDEFADVYHLLQQESPVFPVFFTALNLLGIRVGAVHSELDPSQGEIPEHGDDEVPKSLQELIRRAKRQQAATQPAETRLRAERA